MKIRCSYCGTYIDDTLATCPNCGAPNEGVVRTTSTQPLTIEELKKWYEDRGLPQAETTRFFIGEDYQGPRAFGIYKDEKTGNFVVYKNKNSGERAVRYQGTDEAYAVNELYQRLKQEIIEQKSRAAGKDEPYRGGTGDGGGSKKGKTFLTGIFGAVISTIVIAVSTIFGFFSGDAPEAGYYVYDNEPYYYATEAGDSAYDGWFAYENGEWYGLIRPDFMPEALRTNKTAKSFYISRDWDSILNCTDFRDSIQYQDLLNHFQVEQGYYQHNGSTYYHVDDDAELGWYSYDTVTDDWHEVDYGDLPDELSHQTTAEDFYYTPDWDSETQLKDFEDTEYYREYEENRNSDSGWENSDNDHDYDWDSGDSWDSGGGDWDSDW